MLGHRLCYLHVFEKQVVSTQAGSHNQGVQPGQPPLHVLHGAGAVAAQGKGQDAYSPASTGYLPGDTAHPSCSRKLLLRERPVRRPHLLLPGTAECGSRALKVYNQPGKTAGPSRPPLPSRVPGTMGERPWAAPGLALGGGSSFLPAHHRSLDSSNPCGRLCPGQPHGDSQAAVLSLWVTD